MELNVSQADEIVDLVARVQKALEEKRNTRLDSIMTEVLKEPPKGASQSSSSS